MLSNPSMPGVVKVGCTEKLVSQRAAELGTATGVPTGFVIEAFFGCSEPREAEAQVHQHLAKVRLPKREFFKLEVRDAIDAIERAIGVAPVFQKRRPSGSEAADPWPDGGRFECQACSRYWATPDQDGARVCPYCGNKARKWMGRW